MLVVGVRSGYRRGRLERLRQQAAAKLIRIRDTVGFVVCAVELGAGLCESAGRQSWPEYAAYSCDLRPSESVEGQRDHGAESSSVYWACS